MKELPMLLTVDEVAELLRLKPDTIRRWLRKGRLRGIYLSDAGGWRIRREVVEQFLQELERRSAEGTP